MKTVGILGGMGPAATVDLFNRIVVATPARQDQDHIPIVIFNDPAIPDRSRAILEDGEDPLPRMAEGIARLVSLGVDLIAIPCNTAHHYLPELQASTPVPILDMIALSAQVCSRLNGVKRVGIMATAGTLAVGLYQRQLQSYGLACVEPDEENTAVMMSAIYGDGGIKSGSATRTARTKLLGVGESLIGNGADALILGCTEIPLVMRDGDLPVPIVASNQVLAEAVVASALEIST